MPWYPTAPKKPAPKPLLIPKTSTSGRGGAATAKASSIAAKTISVRPPGLTGSADQMERQLAAAAAAGVVWSPGWNSNNTRNDDGGGNPAPPPRNVQATLNPNELKYNVGCVASAYLVGSKYLQAASGIAADKPLTVGSPTELWSKSRSSKGMISTWVPTGTAQGFTAAMPQMADSPVISEQGRYGFQFHYNPTTIGMAYAGSPEVDVNMETSGAEKFNLAGTAVSQSTIQFDVILNRVADMVHYDPSTELLRADSAQGIYSPRNPTIDEQKLIYTRGTMYDVEYLLSALLGYRLNTKFRGMTADVGYISARPVEIFLGRGLKYLGFISSISVNHTIFDERMVPIFSTVSLGFNRIPDYSGL